MKKTLIPNSIIVFGTIYLSVITWGFLVAEHKLGILFYALVLAIFFIILIYNRDSLACVLKIEDYKLKLDYVFPNVVNEEIDLYKIEGNITLRRFYGGEFAGGLPSWSEYLNYKWYFYPDQYELMFMYAKELKTLRFQVNIIGFKTFLDNLIESTNSIEKDKISSIESNLGKQDLAFALSTLVVKLIIAD